MKKKPVLIIVPIYRSFLSDDEKISWRQLKHYLAQYPITLLVPDDLVVPVRGHEMIKLPGEHFKSVSSYSKLLLNREFYKLFSAYDYILIYQLDALVFSGELMDWCNKGYDYIGAPLFMSPKTPEKGFLGVGNGGLSLRKVSSFMDVLDSNRSYHRPAIDWHKYFLSRGERVKQLIASKYMTFFNAERGISEHLDGFKWNEDLFWSFEAQVYSPSFSVAPLKDALRFSFEVAPRYCYKESDCRMPFGCHAWGRYDRSFWKKHIID